MGHDNLEQTSNINADLVFIGSSRCRAHFDPIFFDTTFKLKSINIGVDGHSEISMAITRLENYLSRNKNPKYIIFSFDPLVSAGDLLHNKNNVHKNAFARYAYLPSNINLPLVNYFQFDFPEKYIPLYAIFKYNNLSHILFSDNDKTWAKYGYDLHDEKWDTAKNPVSNEIMNYYRKKSDIKSTTVALNSLQMLCKKNNAKLLCIQTPVYQVAHNDSIFSESESMCFFLNIPFVDANHEYIRKNIDFFYNSDHLNKSGVHQLNLFFKNNIMLKSFLTN